MKKLVAIIGIIMMAMVIVIDTSLAQEGGTCKVICPGSGVYCQHEDAEGNTTTSQKGADEPAVIEGPCDIILD